MKNILFLSLTLLLAACGGGNQERAPASNGTGITFGNQSITVLGGAVESKNGLLLGTGSVLFGSSYNEFRSGGSYALSFSLTDGGSLTLVSHASDSLDGGWEITFLREGQTLHATITAQGSSEASDAFVGIDASEPISVQIDVHNNESPAHALAWDTSAGENFDETLALLNTETTDNSPGIGTGVRWGLVLRDATVSRADRSSPKFEE